MYMRQATLIRVSRTSTADFSSSIILKQRYVAKYENTMRVTNMTHYKQELQKLISIQMMTSYVVIHTCLFL